MFDAHPRVYALWALMHSILMLISIDMTYGC